MNKQERDLLLALNNSPFINQRLLSETSGYSLGIVNRCLKELLEKGYPSFLLYENDLYKVQTGAYQQIGNAIAMEQRLRDDGYSTIIVTK